MEMRHDRPEHLPPARFSPTPARRWIASRAYRRLCGNAKAAGIPRMVDSKERTMPTTTIARPTAADRRAQDLELLEEDARHHYGAPVAVIEATPAIAPRGLRPAIIECVFAETGLGGDDLDALEDPAGRLPGGGLRELGDKYSCNIGRSLCRGIYYAQIARSGHIEAAHSRGVLPVHAMAIAAELACLLPQFGDRRRSNAFRCRSRLENTNAAIARERGNGER
jgi:hypothetical protein